MAEAGDGVNYRSPLGVTTDETGDSTVRVCLVTPGLRKQKFKNEVANGNVNVQFFPRSLDVKIRLDIKENGKKKSDHIQYLVKQLPSEILPDRSRYKVEKDKIVLLLHKAQPQSWAGALDRGGLETDQSE